MNSKWPDDPLTKAQMAALERFAALGFNPYGWAAGNIGAHGGTVAALEERMLITGGHIYGSRTRSYNITARGIERLAQADTDPKGQDGEAGLVRSSGSAVA